MAANKIYCGNGKKITGEYGTFRSVSICLDDIPEEYVTKSKNGKRYVKLNISDMKEINDYGNDVYATVDTWRPDPNHKRGQQETEHNTQQTESSGSSSNEDDSDLPF
jgi:hypothetical protein